MVLVTTNNALL